MNFCKSADLQTHTRTRARVRKIFINPFYASCRLFWVSWYENLKNPKPIFHKQISKLIFWNFSTVLIILKQSKATFKQKMIVFICNHDSREELRSFNIHQSDMISELSINIVNWVVRVWNRKWAGETIKKCIELDDGWVVCVRWCKGSIGGR